MSDQGAPPDWAGLLARLIAFGIFWFFLGLSVESSVIVLRDVIFEHRLYLPSVGFCLALVAAGNIIRARTGLPGKKMLTICMVALIVAWSSAAYLRNSLWRDPVLLWTDTVQKSPDKYRPHFALGNAYSARGRDQEAIREYREALKADPTSIEAYGHIAEIHLKHRDYVSALAMLEKAAEARTPIQHRSYIIRWGNCISGQDGYPRLRRH